MRYHLDREIAKAREGFSKNFEPYVQLFPAVISSRAGSSTFSELSDNYTWIRVFNRPESLAPAFNPTSIREIGTPVWVKKYPKGPYRWEIVGVNSSYAAVSEQTEVNRFNLPIHGANHVTYEEATPAVDPIYVYQPMNMILKTVGDGATLTVSTYPYETYDFPGATTDLTASVPGSGLIRSVLIYYNTNTETLSTVNGTTVTDDGITPIPRPDIPAGISGVKSAWVILANGQTAVTTAEDVIDARDFLGQSASSGQSTGEVFLTAAGGWPSSTNGCAQNAKNEYATNDQDIYSLDFDQSANEYAQWSVWMPDDWDGGVVAAKFRWTAASGVGNVVWGLQGVSYDDGDALDAAWGSAQEVLDSLMAVNTDHVTGLTNAITIAGSPSPGCNIQLRVYRNTAVGNNLNADAKLLGVKLYYTKENTSLVNLGNLSTEQVQWGNVTADAIIETTETDSIAADADIT